jgi:hypothetical protein
VTLGKEDKEKLRMSITKEMTAVLGLVLVFTSYGCSQQQSESDSMQQKTRSENPTPDAVAVEPKVVATATRMELGTTEVAGHVCQAWIETSDRGQQVLAKLPEGASFHMRLGVDVAGTLDLSGVEVYLTSGGRHEVAANAAYQGSAVWTQFEDVCKPAAFGLTPEAQGRVEASSYGTNIAVRSGSILVLSSGRVSIPYGEVWIPEATPAKRTTIGNLVRSDSRVKAYTEGNAPAMTYWNPNTGEFYGHIYVRDNLLAVIPQQPIVIPEEAITSEDLKERIRVLKSNHLPRK